MEDNCLSVLKACCVGCVCLCVHVCVCVCVFVRGMTRAWLSKPAVCQTFQPDSNSVSKLILKSAYKSIPILSHGLLLSSLRIF